MTKKTCFSIHFDSLGWHCGVEPTRSRDRTFFQVADRFLDLAERYGLRYTIFVIGRDLENREVAARVGEWSRLGHEIASHSYNHLPNLGSLPPEEIEKDVLAAHDRIAAACGRPPRGFVSPAWNCSPQLLRVLARNGYLYDASLFPSYFLWLVLAKVWWNLRKDPRRGTLFKRRDLLASLLASRKPRVLSGTSLLKKAHSGIIELPMPVTPILRLPCWHTVAHVFPGWLYRRSLKAVVGQPYSYYVFHPADLLDRDDLPPEHRDIGIIERLDVPLARKTELARAAIEAILAETTEVVTLEAIASEIAAAEPGGR